MEHMMSAKASTQAFPRKKLLMLICVLLLSIGLIALLIKRSKNQETMSQIQTDVSAQQFDTQQPNPIPICPLDTVESPADLCPQNRRKVPVVAGGQGGDIGSGGTGDEVRPGIVCCVPDVTTNPPTETPPIVNTTPTVCPTGGPVITDLNIICPEGCVQK